MVSIELQWECNNCNENAGCELDEDKKRNSSWAFRKFHRKGARGFYKKMWQMWESEEMTSRELLIRLSSSSGLWFEKMKQVDKKLAQSVLMR